MNPDCLWLLPAPPALGFLVNGLMGRRLPASITAAVALAAVGLPLAVALGFLLEMTAAPPEARVVATSLYTWLSDGDFQVRVGLLLDPLAMVMSLVVLGIGFLIHIYSVGYMEGDVGYRRFFAYMNLFVFFMLLLVLADNLVLTFCGWEGVGLCSYLLIGFRHERKSACDAGRKAFIVNRVGDFGFILGILLTITAFQTVDYGELAEIAANASGGAQSMINLMVLLIFMGAMGKSSQFPLHVWLPDAMEGPTPVSALIHGATMVNAGVYLMCRLSPLLNRCPEVLLVIAVLGLVTALYAALAALGQRDLKRILAYSTISQIGFMFVAVGSGMYALGIFHLVTHGIFKGLLFLAAGAVIHTLGGEQDLGRMGGLFREIPAVAAAFLAGLLALAGVFPLAGFFSKDAILWGGFQRFGAPFWIVSLTGALLTALYCGKLFGVFFGPRRDEGPPHRPGALLIWPPAVLALGALIAGVLGLPMFAKDTLLTRFLGFASPAVDSGQGHELEAIMTVFQGMVIPAFLAASAYLFVRRRRRMEELERSFPRAAAFLADGFGLDKLNALLLATPLRGAARFSARIIDNRIIDGAVNGVGRAAMRAGRLLALLQTGELRHYALSILAGAVALLGAALYAAGIF